MAPDLFAYKGDMLSIPACHLGVFFGFLGRPNRRYRRHATNNSTVPNAILAAKAPSDGAVLGFGGELPVASRVITTTTTSDATHPTMKAAPFRSPPSDARMRMNAVRGIGSSVTPNPMMTRLRIIDRLSVAGRWG